MTDDEHAWYDQDAGPLVRPYQVTRGRTKPAGPQLDLITLVVATGLQPHGLNPEYARVLEVCAVPQSVAEISAKVGLALGVARVVISDLLERDFLMFRSRTISAMPDLEMLQRVLEGIRRL
ncbi:DUF742 domain-containing protein [Saccharothrix mutabilis subsp. mutabilis]|uniref:DUF742 domain-containing protein n=1 Tax=Saccharothrix mutabilis subsp. mutabilis TaxID=66855 RepID=A0ABP3CKV6_9PSEU